MLHSHIYEKPELKCSQGVSLVHSTIEFFEPKIDRMQIGKWTCKLRLYIKFQLHYFENHVFNSYRKVNLHQLR